METMNKLKKTNRIGALFALLFLLAQTVSPVVSSAYAMQNETKSTSNNPDMEIVKNHKGSADTSKSVGSELIEEQEQAQSQPKPEQKLENSAPVEDVQTSKGIKRNVVKDSNAPPFGLQAFAKTKGGSLDFNKPLLIWTNNIAINANNWSDRYVGVGAGNNEEAQIEGFDQLVTYKGANSKVDEEPFNKTEIDGYSLKRNGSKDGDPVFCVEADVLINTNHGYRYFNSDPAKGKQAREAGAFAYWGAQYAEKFKGNQDKFLRHMLYTEANTQKILSASRDDDKREIVDIQFRGSGAGVSQKEFEGFTDEINHAVKASMNYPEIKTSKPQRVQKGEVLKLTDDNKYLQYYKVVSAPEGVNAKVKGNTLEVTTTSYDLKTGDIKLALDVPDRYIFDSHLPRWTYQKPHNGVAESQELIEMGFNDPMEFSIPVEQVFDPFSIILNKTDKDGNMYDAKSSPSLKGAEFTVDFFEGDKAEGKPDRTWVFATDEKGRINLQDEKYFVRGDDLFNDKNLGIVLPLGTIKISETKSPTGFLENSGFLMERGEKTNEKSLIINHQKAGGYSTIISGKEVNLTDSEVSVLEPLIHGGVKIQKYDMELDGTGTQGDGTFSDIYYTILNDGDQSVVVDGKTYKSGEKIITKQGNDKGYFETADDFLPYGDYKIVESTAPTGYLLEGVTERTFKIRKNKEMIDLTKRNSGVVNDVIRGGVKMQKRDLESKGKQPLGGARLDAVFSIINRSDHYVMVDGERYEKDEVVFETRLNEEDHSFTTPKDFLPYGTYEIKEKTAPEGYLDTEDTRTFKIRKNGEIVDMSGEDESIYNQVKRGDFYIRKITADNWNDPDRSQQSMANVQFKVTSQTTGESHTFQTDDNGEFYSHSSWNKHTDDTNGGGEFSSLWFGQYIDEDGNKQMTEPDNDLGALPYDWYTIEELESEANEGYKMWKGQFRISRHEHEVKLNNIENAPFVPEMSTSLATVDGGKVVPYGKEITLIDTISYDELTVGKEYIARGYLVNAEGEKVTEPTEVKFTPEKPNGTVEVPMVVDTRDIAGDILVAFEEFELDGEVILEHKDLEDRDQTVEIPKIKTKVQNDDDKSQVVRQKQNVTLTDTITYNNLEKDKEYVVKGQLMTTDKDGKETPFLDANGEEVHAETTFVAETRNGEVEVEFTFNTGDVKDGGKIVVFEDVFAEDVHYATHSDIEDENQTVTVKETKIGTQALHKLTDLQNALPFEKVTIQDEVMYENTIVGQEYIVKGVLMDKETAKPLEVDGEEVRAEQTFTPESENGSAFLDFEVRANDLRGKDVVVFEKLFIEEETKDGEKELVEITSHEDLEDEKQTIHFENPSIGTLATIDGEKEAFAFDNTVVTDTVSFEGLIPELEYTMRGILMDKETGKIVTINEEPVTGETIFIPEESTGTVELDFIVENAEKLAGRELVVFEKLFARNEEGELEEITNHEDIEDEGQTVKFVNPEIGTTARNQADDSSVILPKEGQIVADVVEYSGFIAGEDYRIEGILMDQETGKPVLVDGEEITAELEFTAEEESGEVEVIFEFDATELAGKDLVVFETAFYGEREVAKHHDIEDERQMVSVKEPETPKEEPKKEEPEEPKKEEPEEPKKEEPEEPKKETFKQTGSDYLKVGVLVVLLAAGAAIVIYKRKKDQADE